MSSDNSDRDAASNEDENDNLYDKYIMDEKKSQIKLKLHSSKDILTEAMPESQYAVKMNSKFNFN